MFLMILYIYIKNDCLHICVKILYCKHNKNITKIVTQNAAYSLASESESLEFLSAWLQARTDPRI